MTKEEFWGELNSRLNRCIGQLLLPRMRTGDPDVIEVHAKLLETAQWVDEVLEENEVLE